jgi:hypothetical protein
MLADGTPLAIKGIVTAPAKIASFRFNLPLLVADIPELDVVLGMDFLAQYDPDIHFKKRLMHIRHKNKLLTIHAYDEAHELPKCPELTSELVEVCSIQSVSKDLMDLSEDDVFLAVVQSVSDVSTINGKGSEQPQVAAIIKEFSDILLAELPPGLPPERVAVDGTKIEHTIETDPHLIPPKSKPFLYTQEELAEIQRQLQVLLEHQWITPSLSPYAAPVLFVRKKPDPVTGKRSLRMCVSYVKLNQKTLNRIAYRLPRISELLDRLTHAKYFTKLDLVSGYHQVRMKTADVKKTAFCTPFGNFEFKVMLFGLCGAPSTFAYLMDEVFRADTKYKGQNLPFALFIAVYLDDVCIFSRTEEEHLEHVRLVLTRLRSWKLFVKPSKCEWLQTTIDFLGHTVCGQGRTVHHARAQALQNWPEPTTVKELRSLLGTFGYWRQYIKDFAAIAAPLTVLTAKHVAWHFGEDQQKALTELKLALLTAPILQHPDMSKPFFLVTDASDFAIGASLEQETDDCRRPVAFFSHRLSQAERAYQVHERELLAIVLGLRTWRHYLLGSEFKVQSVTDHRPLHHFMTQSNLSGRQVRWQQLLSEFNLTISYVQGKANTFADGLSRRPDLRLMLIAAIAPYDPWLHKIQQSMKADAVAYRLLRSATSSKQQPDYRTANGILYYVRDGLHRVYVPDANRLRLQLMQQFHSSPIAGHIGAHKVYLAMRTHYYWPSMEQNITAYVQSCAVCQRTKSTLQPKLPIYPLPVPQRPFELITLDWLGQFPRNSKGHDSVLNIVDKLSKWVIVIPCSKTMNTDDLCQVLWA